MKFYADKLLEIIEKLSPQEFEQICKKDISVDELKAFMDNPVIRDYMVATPQDDPEFKHLPFGVEPVGEFNENKILLERCPSPIEYIKNEKYGPLVGHWIWDTQLNNRRWTSRYDSLMNGDIFSTMNNCISSSDITQSYPVLHYKDFLNLVCCGEIFPFFNQILSTKKHYILKQNGPSFIELDERPRMDCLERGDYLITTLYRGQSKNYSTVLTPTMFRRIYPEFKHSSGVSKLRTYFRNVVREFLFNKLDLIVSFAEAEALLHHFGLMRSASVLDVTYDVNVAKWFALSEYDYMEKSAPYKQKYKIKQFNDKFYESDWSCIYKIIVFVPAQPMMYGFYEKLSKIAIRPKNQAGNCLYGILQNDLDPTGLVINISEHRYHSTFAPDGWDSIGGTNLNFNTDSKNINCVISELPDYHNEITEFLFPDETTSIIELLKYLNAQRKTKFYSKYCEIEKLVKDGKL